MSDELSRYCVRLQGERDELIRFATAAVEECEELATHGHIPPHMRQLRAYLYVLEQRDKPDLDHIKSLLKKYSQ